MGELLDFFLHIDVSLREAALAYPIATYGILFAVIYTETAFFPLAPFFPGDGLLFAIGVLAAGGLIHPLVIIVSLIVAASLGAWTGYRLGGKFGPAMFKKFEWLDKRAYTRSHAFYRKFGATALITSRFLPIVKALVPFVAGVAKMERGRFARYNVMSACIWVISLVSLGYFLGNVPFIRDHTGLLVLGLAVVFITGLGITVITKLIKNRAEGAA